MDTKDTGRVEAFSDGVFAIAITLLVLDLNVGEGSGSLLARLLEKWPSYLAFLTSFATIGIMWLNHHRMFSLIKRVDHTLLLFNGLLLLGVTIVPFPTRVLAEALATAVQAGRDSDEVVAAAFYSGLFVFIAIFFNLLWRYSVRGDRLLGRRVNRAEVDGLTRQYRFGPLYYVVAFLLALVLPLASVVLNLLMALYFALPVRSGESSAEASLNTPPDPYAGER